MIIFFFPQNILLQCQFYNIFIKNILNLLLSDEREVGMRIMKKISFKSQVLENFFLFNKKVKFLILF